MKSSSGHTNPPTSSTLRVVYIPLRNAVAILDTSGPDRVLHLDSDSPPEDHIWALLEALEIVTQSADTATTVARGRHLRLAPDLPRAR
jgi:hypothetical protein